MCAVIRIYLNEMKQNKIDKYGAWCHYCHRGLTPGRFTVDHIVPRSKGGANADSNLVACCKRCNQLKSDYTLEQFRPLFIAEYSKLKNTYALQGKFAFEVSPLIRRKHITGTYSIHYRFPILECVPPRSRPDWDC